MKVGGIVWGRGPGLRRWHPATVREVSCGRAKVCWHTPEGDEERWEWVLDLTPIPPVEAHRTEVRRAKATVRDAVSTRVAELRRGQRRGAAPRARAGRGGGAGFGGVVNTQTLTKVLEIVHRHAPDGVSLWKADHYSLGVCGNLPFTDEERAELEELGVHTYDEGESWQTFL